MTFKNLYIHPKDYYNLDVWQNLLSNKLNDNIKLTDLQLDTCLNTICYNYYKNHIIIDLLLSKLEYKKEYILKHIVNIPCYSFLKYQKLYKKEVSNNDNSIELFKNINKQVNELWKFESKINKKSFNIYTNDDYKLVKTQSLLIWKDYLQFIDQNNKYDKRYVSNVFERCLQMCFSYISIWKTYIEFIKKDKNDMLNLFIIYSRMESSIRKIIKKDVEIKNQYHELLLNECTYWSKVEDDTSTCMIQKLRLYKHVILILKNVNVYRHNIKRLYKIYFTTLYSHLANKFHKNNDIVILYYCNLVSNTDNKIEENMVYKYLKSQNLILLPEYTETNHFLKIFILNQHYNNNINKSVEDQKKSKNHIDIFISKLKASETDLLIWKLIIKTTLLNKKNVNKSLIKKEIIKSYRKIASTNIKNPQKKKLVTNKNIKKLKRKFLKQ
ncbi:hypothetical protein HANVADRAFT_119890 [Hanseniaspora valbyensis NRRL Y-1626]|uniref:Uncharacterized protein n=1 Tax=Hanseniaspora valbyensis NRRL Y-1626 TaxID=766949 RepID=A0A1B7T9U2_9ASCO|nr:hypothetical protein HANVADRAFT_119890 [Hanseniaspora valbyensis NRRL Y-1626]